jgi:predicted ribosomally synthesized peptide with SipW-like signal peptide
VAAVATGVTIALFNDVETSTGNIFVAGTLNLQVGGEDPATWSYSTEDIKPGDTDKEFVTIQNTGSLDGYLHITFANLINDEMGCTEPEGDNLDTTCGNPGNNEGELAENLDILIYLDENEDEDFDLGIDTLIYQGKVRGILQGDLFNYPLSSGDSKEFTMEWELDSSVGNIVQSDKTGYDINFELTQNKQEEIVGDWHFDENAGAVAYDSSGYNNQGAINGAIWADGKYNPALSFDGDDNVVINDSDTLKPEKVTLEAWVKRDGTPGVYKYIAGKRYGGGWGSYHLYTGPSGGLKFYIGHNGGYIASPDAGTGIWDNSWHHITGTYDGSIVKLYVDGAEIPGGTGTTQDIAYNTENFYIGSYGNGYYFSGLVDEVRVYSKALSGAEILENYQKGI